MEKPSEYWFLFLLLLKYILALVGFTFPLSKKMVPKSDYVYCVNW